VKEALISKHRKYTTGNFISRFLVRNFFETLGPLISGITCSSIIDVGCGEGILLSHIGGPVSGKRLCGLDADPKEIETARVQAPFARFVVGSIYDLPFRDGQFDLVICTEVLEHLESPEKALKQLSRVAARYCIFSVPNEPIWRILNMTRGAYMRRLGNTPGHVNHWSRKSFEGYVSSSFHILKVMKPLPWILALCERKEDPEKVIRPLK
jgi:2-polyprenyl-3-methyl-5-hydroxy-6-metoxy-1,4-benzoquinol methylase